MYTIAVTRDFIARHFLVGGDWGPENKEHSHHYRVEVQLEGAHLNQHGYLVDIVEIEDKLDSIVETYREKVLNELPGFSGLNPSIEHFARIITEGFSKYIEIPNLAAISVKVYENEVAWASYQLKR